MKKRIEILIFLLVPLTSFSWAQSVINVDVSTLFEQAIDSIEPPSPLIKPLFQYHLRDVAVCQGPGHTYYLTGTTDDNWGVADGIRVWKSSDLESWEMIGREGFVWTFDRDGSNERQKEIVLKKNRLIRGIWAPEIHYLKGNFWITYSVSNGYGSGLLRSSTGLPEGPYVDVEPSGAMVKGIDATLFEEDDGTIWFIWGPGKMKKMKADMSGFADASVPVFPVDANGKEVGYEGVNVYKRHGIYYLMAAEWNTEGPKWGHLMRGTDVNRRAADGRYDCMIAMSENLTGPYTPAYIALAHGGHNCIFDDYEGRTWATLFGNDEAAAPFREVPALVQMEFDDENRIRPVIPYPFKAENEMPVIYVSEKGNDNGGDSWKRAYSSLQKAIDAAGPGTQVWISEGIYKGRITIKDKQGLYLYGGFSGKEKQLEYRDITAHPVIIDGEGVGTALEVRASEYIRVDGLTVTGGKALGQDVEACGGGVFISGGGESLRFVNCSIRENYALGHGGGVYISAGASPLFIGCEISHNTSQGNGGALYADCRQDNGYHTRLYNCDIHHNRAELNGGVAYMETDLKQTGTLRFINCLIRKNFTLLEGGNIVLKGGATLLMSHCTVVDNSGMSKGTAIASLGRVPAQNRIVNSIFKGNCGATLFTADAYEGSDPTTGFEQHWTRVLNCLFSDNKTLGIFGFNHIAQRWSDVDNLNAADWASGNISGDPAFRDHERDDYRLGAGSAAIGRGTADNAFPADFEGQARRVDFQNLENCTDIGFDTYDNP